MPVLRTPAFLPLLASTLGLFRHPRRGLDDPALLPRIERALAGATLDPAWLAAYRGSVGLSDGARLPPLALQLAAAPVHMAILGDAQFPFRALGLVHMAQRVTQTRPIPGDATLELRACSADARWEKRGMSFGLVTEAWCEGECVWRGETRALAPGKSLAPAPAPAAGATDDRDAARPACDEVLHVPEATGRRYAAIAVSLNPIHQHALLARLFGFRRAIVHGTWTLARALALAELPGRPAFTLEAHFRRPVELPSDIRVRAWSGAGAEMGNPSGRPHRVTVSEPHTGKTCIDILLAESARPGRAARVRRPACRPPGRADVRQPCRFHLAGFMGPVGPDPWAWKTAG
jgi:acyl dehydratase